jgi:hypothetical protein
VISSQIYSSMRTHIDSCLGVEAVHGANELKESSSKREVYAVRLGEPVELWPALQNAVEIYSSMRTHI